MRFFHSLNYSAFTLRSIIKHLSEDDAHDFGNFESYFVFATGKGDVFLILILPIVLLFVSLSLLMVYTFDYCQNLGHI